MSLNKRQSLNEHWYFFLLGFYDGNNPRFNYPLSCYDPWIYWELHLYQNPFQVLCICQNLFLVIKNSYIQSFCKNF